MDFPPLPYPSPTPPPSRSLTTLQTNHLHHPCTHWAVSVSVIDWFSLNTGNALSTIRSRGKLDSHRIKMRTTLLKSFRKFQMPNVNNFSKVKHKNYPGNGNTCWPLQKSNRERLEHKTRSTLLKSNRERLEHKTRSTLLKSNRKGLNTKPVRLY